MSFRIQFLKDGAQAPVDLAPGGKSSPESMHLLAQRDTEVPPILRAEQVEPIDRKNLRHEFSFPVWREHASLASAGVFYVDHPGQVCGVGKLIFEADIDGQIVRREARGSVKISDSDWEGVSTTHTYAVVCGAITTRG